MAGSGEAAYIIWSNSSDWLFFNMLGILICVYSLYVEIRKEKDPGYRALCDLNEHMSCSRVLTSEYSHGFGFMHLLFGENHMLNSRNCNLGLVIYLGNILTGFILPAGMSATILYYTSIMSVLGCVYLAFILFFILKDLCLVCLSIYAVNGCLLYLAYSVHKL